MKKIIIIIVLVVIGILGVSKFINYSLQKERKEVEMISQDIKKLIDETNNVLKGEDSVAKTEKTFEVNVGLGYPSAGYPSMNVYLKEVNTGLTYKLSGETNKPKTKFINIPEGVYYAYAYTNTNEIPNTLNGAYTEFAKCDMRPECTSHKLIPIKVNKDYLHQDDPNQYEIQIVDWYHNGYIGIPKEENKIKNIGFLYEGKYDWGIDVKTGLNSQLNPFDTFATVIYLDLNFDGMPDELRSLGTGASGVTSYDVSIYDPATKKFVKNRSFGFTGDDFAYDYDKKTYYVRYVSKRDNSSMEFTIYKIEANKVKRDIKYTMYD